ncbi:MAG: DUF1553 domain-containing protein [Pirellulales bacterium]
MTAIAAHASAAEVNASDADTVEVDFATRVAPILRRKCLSCHNDDTHEGGLTLQSVAAVRDGGDSGEVVVAGQPDASYLVDLITPVDGEAEMPQGGKPLSDDEQAILRQWIASGAQWPADYVVEPETWWSLRPLERPSMPKLSGERAAWCRTPIDRFIAARHEQLGLQPAAEADRRTLIRRLSFDLTGLPPTPAEIDAFLADTSPGAYERLVDRLLDSPRYGERWARHWLDVVHYGETHGYDKDKPRPNAWPYRDYVIRAFNEDKPYAQFIEEQVAGDVLHAGSVDGIEALGFIAAGPWDFIGHAEVPESKIDGKVARHLDRDDMVRTTMLTFVSLTVGCAQCHDHKFDPITQREYYGLQSVFAALDRADREYYADPALTQKHDALWAQRRTLEVERDALAATITEQGGEALADVRERLAAAEKSSERPTQYGYHSAIESDDASEDADGVKWVQVDLGGDVPIQQIELIACDDDFNNIGPGFGFPVRYKVELADDADFGEGVRCVADRTVDDVENPGTAPQSIALGSQTARYVRVTATKLAPRQNDFIFALAELKVLDDSGENVALGKAVTARDSIESGERWGRENLVDGLYPGAAAAPETIAALEAERDATLQREVDAAVVARQQAVAAQLAEATSEIDALPAAQRVFAGTVHYGSGAFRGTGPDGGRPRPVFVLARGDVTKPGDQATPGALGCIAGLEPSFDDTATEPEGERRARLAMWLASSDNPLTWRSIVNRIWQYHFGRGIVATPEDFGHMGELPTHPELLDWLAVEFRDGGGSLKQLHRLIVTSAVYRQSSRLNDCPQCNAAPDADAASKVDPRDVDVDNRFLWRANRRQLEAEALRDAILSVSGRLDLEMGGPSFQDLVVERPEHSPHYEYRLHDPEDPHCHRRSIYRFIVRSQTQPFMTALDCADPSIMVSRRNQTITPLQALTMLNNKLALVMARHFAERIAQTSDDVDAQITDAYQIALGRSPNNDELESLREYAAEYGMANVCRVIMNLNEFAFVD